VHYGFCVNLRIDPNDYPLLVAHLGDRVRAKQAFSHLIRSGSAALPAVREGLASANSDVRMYCARALDHLVDAEAWPALLAMLDDPDPRVRLHTLHAISCDRCKDNVPRPEKAEVLPRAIEILRGDPIYHVRLMAVEVVARWVHEDSTAETALISARDGDVSPAVRKKAHWFAPGGTIFRKTKPETAR
jgi:HEAT repeat protein